MNVRYIRKADRTPVATLVTEKQHHLIKAGFAKCHPGDDFEKSRGKQIAVGRLLKHDAAVQRPYQAMVSLLQNGVCCVHEEDIVALIRLLEQEVGT